jgi:hypothetical protein
MSNEHSNEHAADKPHPKEVTVIFNGRPKTRVGRDSCKKQPKVS